ncbi:MAG: hypothetical protein V3U60_16530 [Gammaproteobacteria bacterium]
MLISEMYQDSDWRHQIGGNNPPADNSFEAMQERTAALIANADRWLTERPVFETQDEADKCKDFRDQLSGEGKAIEAERKAKKQPHLDAGTAVDAQYNPLKLKIKTAYDLLEPPATAWLQRQQAIQDEIARKAEAEALAKIQAEQEAQRKAQEAATVENTIQAEAATKEADTAAIVADRASKVRAKTKGRMGGKAMSLRTVKTVEITDLALVFEHFRHRSEVHDILQRLATAEDRSGKDVPGIEITETQKAI